jgi:hypothetical protein
LNDLTESMVIEAGGGFAPPEVPEFWPRSLSSLDSLTEKQWAAVKQVWSYRGFLFRNLEDEHGEETLIYWLVLGGLPPLLTPVDRACQRLITLVKGLPQDHAYRAELGL